MSCTESFSSRQTLPQNVNGQIQHLKLTFSRNLRHAYRCFTISGPLRNSSPVGDICSSLLYRCRGMCTHLSDLQAKLLELLTCNNYSFLVLRIVFRENYGYSNEYQSVDIKVLLHQNIQCINILAQAPDTQYAGYVCMTMSRTKITYNQFYNC